MIRVSPCSQCRFFVRSLSSAWARLIRVARRPHRAKSGIHKNAPERQRAKFGARAPSSPVSVAHDGNGIAANPRGNAALFRTARRDSESSKINRIGWLREPDSNPHYGGRICPASAQPLCCHFVGVNSNSIPMRRGRFWRPDQPPLDRRGIGHPGCLQRA